MFQTFSKIGIWNELIELIEHIVVIMLKNIKSVRLTESFDNFVLVIVDLLLLKT